MVNNGENDEIESIERESWRTVLDHAGEDATLNEIALAGESVGACDAEVILSAGEANDGIAVLNESNSRFLVTGSDYDLERISDEITVHDSVEQVSRHVADDPHIGIVATWEELGGAEQ